MSVTSGTSRRESEDTDAPETPTVFRGGAVYTLDPDRPWASAVAVRGDRIVAVGSDEDAVAAAGPDARIVELDGRMVLPGFVEGHIHPVMGALFTSGADLQVPTYDDLLGAVSDYAATTWNRTGSPRPQST